MSRDHAQLLAVLCCYYFRLLCNNTRFSYDAYTYIFYTVEMVQSSNAAKCQALIENSNVRWWYENGRRFHTYAIIEFSNVPIWWNF